MQTYRQLTVDIANRTQRATRFTLDHWWILGVLWLIWLLMSLLPLPPNDLWWHMEAGRIMADERIWLRANRWSYTLPYDALYIYQSWLSELLLYGFWWLGDVPLLSLARTLAITGSYGLIAWHALRRSRHGVAVALALLLAALVSWSNWTLRPQTLALVPAAAFAVIIGEYLGGRASTRWLAALPLIMIVWVNAHGSFMVGGALIACVWLGAALRLACSSRAARRAALRQLGVWSAISAAVLVAMLVNPLGPGIFTYVRDLFGNTSVQTRIIEWQPPRNSIDPLDSGFWFFAMLFLIAALMAKSPRRPSLVDVLWFCGLAWMGISAGRHIMWFALLLLPLLADQLAALLGERRPAPSQPTFSAAFGLLLGLSMLATLPWFAPAQVVWPQSPLYATSGPHRMLLSRKTPVAATEWLAQHPIDGRFWTDMSYTSYTVWRLPGKQIFADLRIELYPEQVWDEYNAIARGDEQSQAKLDAWQITHVLLDREWQQALYQRLLGTPGWCERFRDGDAAILTRCQ